MKKVIALAMILIIFSSFTVVCEASGNTYVVGKSKFSMKIPVEYLTFIVNTRNKNSNDYTRIGLDYDTINDLLKESDIYLEAYNPDDLTGFTIVRNKSAATNYKNISDFELKCYMNVIMGKSRLDFDSLNVDKISVYSNTSTKYVRIYGYFYSDYLFTYCIRYLTSYNGYDYIFTYTKYNYDITSKDKKLVKGIIDSINYFKPVKDTINTSTKNKPYQNKTGITFDISDKWCKKEFPDTDKSEEISYLFKKDTNYFFMYNNINSFKKIALSGDFSQSRNEMSLDSFSGKEVLEKVISSDESCISKKKIKLNGIDFYSYLTVEDMSEFNIYHRADVTVANGYMQVFNLYYTGAKNNKAIKEYENLISSLNFTKLTWSEIGNDFSKDNCKENEELQFNCLIIILIALFALTVLSITAIFVKSSKNRTYYNHVIRQNKVSIANEFEDSVNNDNVFELDKRGIPIYDFRTNKEKKICLYKQIGIWALFVLGCLILGYFTSLFLKFKPGYLIPVCLFWLCIRINKRVKENSLKKSMLLHE